jgi:hypothetical protein
MAASGQCPSHLRLLTANASTASIAANWNSLFMGKRDFSDTVVGDGFDAAVQV